jgi:hypothetical protein
MQKLTRSPQGILVPNGVQRTPLKLTNGARNSFLTIIARARVTVTVAAATAVLNRGSAFALAEEVLLDENGTEKSICTGKALRYWSEMNAPSALSATRLVAAANGTLPVGVYQLEEAARFHFAHPLSQNPLETTYTERNQTQAFNFVVRRVADAVANLVTAGPATVVVDNIAFTVIQGYEEATDRGIKAPIFLPSITQQTLEITGANAKKLEYIITSNQIRGLILSQEVDGIEVNDIINSVGLRGQLREIVGPNMLVADVLLDSEFEFGGAVMTSNRSHMGWNFQRYGQLSETLSPVQDLNLRWELDVQKSARAGTSTVRTTIFELLRDPRVTAANVPFPA